MTGALIILGVTIAFGLLLFWAERKKVRRQSDEVRRRRGEVRSRSDEVRSQSDEVGGHSGGICCEMHAVCEKLASPYVEEPVYYEDEELDRYRGRQADGYTEEETEEFREVLMTMRDDEVKGWLESLERRGVTLPDGLRDEVGIFL